MVSQGGTVLSVAALDDFVSRHLDVPKMGQKLKHCAAVFGSSSDTQSGLEGRREG